MFVCVTRKDTMQTKKKFGVPRKDCLFSIHQQLPAQHKQSRAIRMRFRILSVTVKLRFAGMCLRVHVVSQIIHQKSNQQIFLFVHCDIAVLS